MDMVQEFQIVRHHDNVDGVQWFRHVSRDGYLTRAVADPGPGQVQAGQVEIFLLSEGGGRKFRMETVINL